MLRWSVCPSYSNQGVLQALCVSVLDEWQLFIPTVAEWAQQSRTRSFRWCICSAVQWCARCWPYRVTVLPWNELQSFIFLSLSRHSSVSLKIPIPCVMMSVSKVVAQTGVWFSSCDYPTFSLRCAALIHSRWWLKIYSFSVFYLSLTYWMFVIEWP